jgi:hypothetical protein
MITIIPFNHEHAFAIEENPTDEFRDAMYRHETDGTALTLMVGDEIMSCGGVMLLSQGVAEIWTLNGPLIKKYPIEFHKFILDCRDKFQKQFNLVRMQAPIQSDIEMNIKWIESLGFKREGLMRKYYGDKDFYMYSRIQGEDF